MSSKKSIRAQKYFSPLPVLLVQRGDERNVPFGETLLMMEALRKQGVEAELLVIPDEIHGFVRHESWLRAYHAAAVFLDRHLGGNSG